MYIKEYEKAQRTAQKISFAYEDQFNNKDKRKIFVAVFDRFLNPVDPEGQLEHYDAIVALWRKNPAEYDQMVNELTEASLI